MNKTILILIISVILAVLIGGYFLYFNQSPSYKTNLQSTQSAQSSQLANLSASVSIKNFAFNPTPLNIKAGTKVVWTNNDTAPHQIKSNTFNSAVLNNEQTFSFTFSVAGQFNYSCAIHPSMHGQIIVSQ